MKILVRLIRSVLHRGADGSGQPPGRRAEPSVDLTRRTVVRVLGATPLAVLRLPAFARPTTRSSRVAILAVGTAPRSAPFPASHLGIRWRGSPAASIEVRYAGTGGWTPWQQVAVHPDLIDEELGVHCSVLVRAVGATWVQVRAAGAAERLEVVMIDAAGGDRPPLPIRTVAPSSASAQEAASETRQPELVGRSQWGADESRRKEPPEFAGPIVKLVVHHTVTPNDDPDPASTVRAIYAYHTQSRGWNDIGYNFLIDAAGRIYEGRFARPYRPGEIPTGEDESRRGVVGAHAKGANPRSGGVALLGDFSSADPSPAALDALVRLLAWKASRHGIDPHAADPYTFSDGTARRFPNVAGHRDVVATTCPGDRLAAALPEIRRRVAEAIATVPTSTPEPDRPQAPEPQPAPPPIPGFWVVSADGTLEAVGDAPYFGTASGAQLQAPLVSMAVTRTGGGYWLASGDGQVFAFGDAHFSGSAASRPLAASIVRLEPTPTSDGYWLAKADGEVLPFGDAGFYGSAVQLPGVTLVGMAATTTGGGYWLASSDGRVFAFGDALNGATASGQPISGIDSGAAATTAVVSMAASPAGQGYWLLTRDGQVFAVDAPHFGSVPERGGHPQLVQIRASYTGQGYYIAGADGAVFAFGDGEQRRERPGGPGVATVADVTMRPLQPRAASVA